MTKKQKILLARILMSAVLLGLSILFEEKSAVLHYLFFALSYLVVGYDIIRRAVNGIIHGRPLDENFLMVVATIGAICLGEVTEGVAVMIFYQVGELFESIAVGKSRKNIRELIDIRPDYANIETPDGQTERVDPTRIEVGQIILVMPGEKVPIDGIVESGTSFADTSALTGESQLREITPGDEILSGTINMTSVIRLRTTKEFGESTASKILNLVENASSRKAKSEDFISKFARIYTPAVCLCALALAVLPPLILLITGQEANWSDWIYRALTFLVISCPCALVISVPLAFFGGLGGASQCGILIKGSNYMEPLSNTRCVVLDKTGTMTKGVFEVAGVHHCPIEDQKLIELAAQAECCSPHPISLSLQRAYSKPIDERRTTNVREIVGEGVTADVDEYHVAAGNGRLMDRLGIEYLPCRTPGTIVHVTIDGIYSGHILIKDQVKENAAEAVEDLKKAGVEKTVMLTGDNERMANHVAEEIGIDEVHANLLPADKLECVETLMGQKKREKDALMFVGDGINDAPVLARSDVGVAMGGIGSDAAIEAADVVLMDDDPMKIAKAIRIASKCMKIVYENIWVSIGIKIICLALSAVGYSSMWLATFADTGVLILAVLNSFRAMHVENV